MPNSFIEPFTKAIDKRNKLEWRPGYPVGLFTRLRHSQKVDTDVIDYLALLKNTSDEEQAKRIIFNLFLKRPFNNHSFLAYLYDELLITHPALIPDLNLYNPRSLVCYEGTLYRGVLKGPKTVFKEGFRLPDKISSLEESIRLITGHAGV